MKKRFLPNKIKRLVIKVGSSSIVNQNGEVRLGFLGQLVTVISRLQKSGISVVLVSSGAIAMGFTRLGFKQRPNNVTEKQACASAGQTELMALYQKLFETCHIQTGQVLLTRDDLEDRRRYLNAREMLEKLLELSIIPIVNENDSVGVDELLFGDNDHISALVAGLVDADLLLLLTDVEGVLDAAGTLIEHVNQPPEELELCNDSPKSADSTADSYAPAKCILGSGGMKSKLEAARICRQSGIHCVIARSSGHSLMDIIAGENIGTYFVPLDQKLYARKRWLYGAAAISGSLQLDDGAIRALVSGQKSLLPSGVLKVIGIFKRGAVLNLLDKSGAEIAKGIVRYRSTDLEKICGLHGDQIENTLGYTFGDEVIHRDDLVLTN